MTEDPSALQATQKLVAEQIKVLELTAATGDALRVQKEGAILDAYSRREAGVYTLHQTNILGGYLDSLTRTSMESTKAFSENMTLLSREIRSFSDRADRATRLVAFCTIGLAVVTFFLVLATGALVWVEMKKVEAPTIGPPPSPAVGTPIPPVRSSPKIKFPSSKSEQKALSPFIPGLFDHLVDS